MGSDKSTTRRFSRVKPAALLSALAIGAVTASVGITAPVAFADTGYPSWDEVQKAKQSEATKKAQIDAISGLLTGLQKTADAASKVSQVAAEAYRMTLDDLDAATAKEASLAKQAASAKTKAETSKLRAGLIAAHLAKTGAQDLSVNLFLNGSSADDLLHQLGTASKLSEQSQTIYREATQDQNTAESLGAQASSATAERDRLTKDSKAKFTEANAAAQSAQAALETQQQKSNELFEQLALLKDTTAEAERSYRAGIDAAAAAKALADAQAAADAAKPPAGNGGGSGGGSGGNSGGGAGTPSVPNPPTVTNPPVVTNPPPVTTPPVTPADPTPPVVTVPPPSASAVDTAINFARAQLGDRYELGGSGPDAWDCSGLTKAAYAAAGIYIGTHSATNQYREMSNRGRLVSFSQAQVGDLVFWGVPGNYYHVAIYMGGGQILEAPDYGKPVRIHPIWSWGDVAPYVGRPSG
ncbi:C40 family peptidase [Leifsonia sp. A12D58]|uniref:C40 family peptidase n=1 Tax=Leifsonia sp. A12D58 TaxID=3397674 RepID=UPI0039DFD0D6